jgi:hypothetical protein
METDSSAHRTRATTPPVQGRNEEDKTMDIRGVVGESGQIRPARGNETKSADPDWWPLAVYFSLRRRGVLRAGTGYVVVAWVIAQVAELIGDIFAAPDWMLRALIIALALGLPVVLMLSWAFELTPSGLRPERGALRPEAIAHGRGRSLLCVLIGILVLTVGALVVQPDPSVCAYAPETEAAIVAGPGAR